MTATTYAQVLTLVRGHEGGKVDNPKDPGGRTKGGVTQVVYDHYRTNKGLATRDVWDMEDAEQDEIFKNQYWDACSCDRLPPGLDYAVFDYAVNSGPEQAIKDLQRVVGAGVDGQVGEQTIALVCAAIDRPADTVDDVIVRYCDKRMSFLKTLRTWKTFGAGWDRRVEGQHVGAQSDDDGVIDLAIKISLNFHSAQLVHTIVAPQPIGANAGEVAGKGTPASVAVTKTPQGKSIMATAVGLGGTAMATAGDLADKGQKVADTAQKVAGVAVTVHDSAHKIFGIFDATTFHLLAGGSLLLSVAGCAFFGWQFVQSQREKAVG